MNSILLTASAEHTYDFFVDFPDPGDQSKIINIVNQIQPLVKEIRLTSSGEGTNGK